MKDYSIQEISFLSCNGEDNIKGVIYVPNTCPCGILQISHGMCEYIGRYHHFMEDMVSKGFIVCGHDHLGHGASSDKGKYGYFGKENGYKNLVKDLHSVTEIVKEKFPDLPYFLFGHSMGSFITRLYISKYANELDGVVICGTGGPNPMATIGTGICTLMIKAKGPMHRSALLDQIAFGVYNMKFKPRRTTKDWLTRDTQIVDKYLNDPKCMFLFTACGYRDLTQLSKLANSADWFKSVDDDLPILLISGDMDPVGSYGKGVQKVFKSLQSCGVKDVSIHLYEDARHELLNETNYDEVFNDVYSWISEHISKDGDKDK